MTKDERIKSEYDRISELFKDVDESKRSIVNQLLRNSAFMAITLEDLQETINRDGMIDFYQNGEKQSGLKQSASLQAYNALIKNYAQVIKQLLQLLPETTQTSARLKQFMDNLEG